VSSAAAATASIIGVVLADKYRVIREIGRGGMGVVYECEHTTLGKRVAVKLMLEKYSDDTEAMARFQREALAASKIGNPHIIDVNDIGVAPDGRSFVVMELLAKGMPLAHLIEQGPVPSPRAIVIMRQVLRAVGAAHGKGIVHRDLKPDNIFLLQNEDGEDFVKLLDFGISKVIGADESVAATKLTTTGVVIGTPLYMAPEQAMGETVERYADIYALGVIMYEMLAGKPPFEGATYAVLISKLLTTDAPLLSDVRPGLSPKLVATVHRALEKDPLSRFASAEDFAAALPAGKSASQMELAGTMQSGKHASSSAPALQTPASIDRPLATRRKSAKWPWVAAVGFVIAAAGAVGFYLTKEPKRAPELPSQSTLSPVEPAATPPDPTPGSAVTPALGRMVVDVKPEGALVTIDDVSRGPSPVDVTLTAGEHKVVLSAQGHELVTFVREVRAGEETKIAMQLPLVPQPRQGSTTTAPKKPGTTTATNPTKGPNPNPFPSTGSAQIPTPQTNPSNPPPDIKPTKKKPGGGGGKPNPFKN
jgi:serine/threonine-protein kinase